jgi:hypothetical protein
VNGVHQDPLSIVHQPEGRELTASARQAFEQAALATRAQLAAATLVQHASAQ